MKKNTGRMRFVLVLILLLTFVYAPAAKAVSTAELSAEGRQRTTDALVMYLESSVAYVHNEKTYVDENNPEVKPVLKNERTFVPVRFVAESLGAEVNWNEDTSTAAIVLGDETVTLTVGSASMKVNDRQVTLEAPVFTAYDRTMVPLRAVSEAFGKEVFYDRDLVIISDAEVIHDTDAEKALVDTMIGWFTNPETYTAAPTGSGTTELTTEDIAAYSESVVMVLTLDASGKAILQGSGFCVGNGLILTNYHVIANGYGYRMITNDNKQYELAGIVKMDKSKDLAILKMKEALDMQPLKLGSKDMVALGERIVTIGSPEGLLNTISDGIVSGFRNLQNTDMIQITAPITHGSPGGPLFNLQGYVIGINSQGAESGNLNFAVAIDYVNSWMKELATKSFSQIQATGS